MRLMVGVAGLLWVAILSWLPAMAPKKKAARGRPFLSAPSAAGPGRQVPASAAPVAALPPVPSHGDSLFEDLVVDLRHEEDRLAVVEAHSAVPGADAQYNERMFRFVICMH